MTIEELLQLQGRMVGLLLGLGWLLGLGGGVAIEVGKFLLQIGLRKHRLTGQGRIWIRRS
jgi:hypothetical protein